MINCLQHLVNEKKDQVMQWINKKRDERTLPVYASFDIRDNGVKASIVDSNLFPAGFNNLTQESQDLASDYFKTFLPTVCEKSTHVLVIPEAHTRNTFYLSNLHTIQKILIKAGYKVTLGSVRDDIEDTLEVVDSNGHTLTLEKMKNVKGDVQTESYKCGLILLNNDFSVQAPELLAQVTECIAPPVRLGWLHRRKSTHFQYFNELIKEFCKELDIDPWLLSVQSQEVSDIDFMTGQNMDKVATTVDEMIASLQQKYDQYGIKDKPYVFVKDNSGTYGMGVLSVHSGQEVLDLNSKNRRKMKSGKQQNAITSVLIQEGIPTKYVQDDVQAEPVLYSVGGKVVGGFMRVHDAKDEKQSLNSPGAKFDELFRDNLTKPILDYVGDNTQLSVYTLLANIANLAIAREMEDV